MEEKKVGSVLLLFKACHWTLCHISAGASSSSALKHCARALCLLLCLFWTELGISCTFGLQPKSALISIANAMWFLCSSPLPSETLTVLPGTAWPQHCGSSAGSESCPGDFSLPSHHCVPKGPVSGVDALGRLHLALSAGQPPPR